MTDYTHFGMIEDPLERCAQLSKEARRLSAELREVSRLRDFAVLEAYNQGHKIRHIAAQGGIDNSKIHKLLNRAGYVPRYGHQRDNVERKRRKAEIVETLRTEYGTTA